MKELVKRVHPTLIPPLLDHANVASVLLDQRPIPVTQHVSRVQPAHFLPMVVNARHVPLERTRLQLERLLVIYVDVETLPTVVKPVVSSVRQDSSLSLMAFASPVP